MIKWIVVIFLACGLLYFVLPEMIRRICRRRFHALCRRQSSVFLTFDDGPDPEFTPKILELLKQYDVQATFFVLGEKVRQYPEIVRQIIAMGHEVGEHGYAHIHAWKSGPVRAAVDLFKARRVLVSIAGPHDIKFFRPPYGKLNLVSLLYAIFFRRKIIFWDIDPRDYQAQDAHDVASYVLKRLKPGSVILLHDGRRTLSDPIVTVLALQMILEATAHSPLEFKPIYL